MAAEPLTKDARGFVDGVVTYLREDKKTRDVAPKVQTLLSKVSAAARKQKVAHVTASVELTSKETDKLAGVLAKFLGHEVDVETTVDASLLGGFRINVGDWVVDTSLATSVDALGQSLL